MVPTKKEVKLLAGNIIEAGKIELVEVAEPELPPRRNGEGDIIFQPELGCLCGSDIPYFQKNDEEFVPEVGHSLHEMIGSVVDTSGDRFKTGDRVLAIPIMQQGLYERYAISETRVIPLDPRRPQEQALLAQPLGTAIFALKKLPPVIDQDVVVVGQGPMGQLFVAALRNLGARRIIGIDLLESRLEVSPQMGATHTICSAQDDPISAVNEITGGQMADVVIEAVGHEHQQLNLCIDLCRLAGRILYFGVPPQVIDGIRWRELLTKNLTIHTSVNPDFRRDFPLAMQWIGEGRIDVSKIITHRFPLTDIQTAFETFRDRKEGALKVLIDFPSGQNSR